MSSAAGSSSIPCRLRGKVAIVTGSTDGIGLAIADRLGSEGAAVLISSRQQQNVEQAVQTLRKKGLRVEGVVCHVGNADDRKLLFKTVKEKFGGLDILVSNAAVNPSQVPVLEPMDIENSVRDKIYVTPSARIGIVIPLRNYIGITIGPMHVMLGAYSVSKTALLGLTKAASIDLAPENIRVNCLAPGIIPTVFSKILTATDPIRDMFLSTVPMGRLGKAEEMAGTVAFLVSEDAGYITGETIVAAGGMHSRL